MRIELLRIEDFKSYRFAEIEFGPDVTAILGANGVGKTTILEAISYALFNHATDTLGRMVREGAKESIIEVQLSLRGGSYLIERRFNAKGTTRHRVYASPVPGADILAEGVRGVQQWVRDRLGIGPDTDMATLCKNTIAVPQGELASVFGWAPVLRKQVFDPLLHVEDFRKASDNLRETAGRLTDKASVLKADQARMEGMLAGKPDLEEEGLKLTEDILQTGIDLKDLLASLQVMAKQAETFDEAQVEAQRTGALLAEAQIQHEAQEKIRAKAREAFLDARAAETLLEDNLIAHAEYVEAEEKLEGLEASRKYRDGLLRELARAHSKLARYISAKEREPASQAKLDEWAARVADVQGGLLEAAAIKKQIAVLDGLITDARASSDTAFRARGKAEAIKDALSEQAGLLADPALAVCPTCGTELTPDTREALLFANQLGMSGVAGQMAELTAQGMALARESKAIHEHQEELRNGLRLLSTQSDLTKAQKEEQQWRSDVMSLRLDIERADAEQAFVDERKADLVPYADLDSLLARFQAQQSGNVAAHKTYMSNLALAEHVSKRKDELDQVQSEHARLTEVFRKANVAYKIARAAYNPQGHNRLREDVKAAERAVASSEATLLLKQTRLAVVEAGLLSLEALEAKHADLTVSLQETEKTHETLQWIRGVLREAGPYVTRRLVRKVSQHASEIFSELVGDPGLRLSWSEDYEVTVQVGPYTRAWSQLSGGQKMCAALALRLALLRELSGIDVAFFDEPSAHLNQEWCQSLAESVSRLTGFSQIFVISHNETFDSAAENTVRIVLDETGSHVSD